MPDTAWPGKLLFHQQALARARRFQIETAIVSVPDGRKRLFKRALHGEGIAHLRRMAANYQTMRIDPGAVLACPCEMRGNMLEMKYIEGISLKQQLIRALRFDDRPRIASLLEQYRRLVTAFDHHAADLAGPCRRAEIFADIDPETETVVLSGNIDQGFDHLILGEEGWTLIDYEWVLGFPVPLKYVLYRASQLFFQDVPPQVSPRFRLRDMCEFYGIGPLERTLYDRMEARFQGFVRSDAGAP